MDFVQIERFLTVSKFLNMGKAAEVLYISQPALSQSISKLEKELGFPLFKRESNRLLLTPNGEALTEDFQRIQHSYEMFQNKRNRLLGGEDLKDITVAMVSNSLLFTTFSISEFFTQYKEAYIKTVLDRYNALEPMLLRGYVDFVISYPFRSHPDISHVNLYEEPVCVAVPVQHLLANKDFLSLKDLLGAAFLGLNSHYFFRSYCDYLFDRVGLRLHYSVSADRPVYSSEIEKNGRDGKNLCLVGRDSFPHLFDSGHYVLKHIEGDPFRLITQLSWHSLGSKGIEHRDFIEFLTEMFLQYRRVSYRLYQTVLQEAYHLRTDKFADYGHRAPQDRHSAPVTVSGADHIHSFHQQNKRRKRMEKMKIGTSGVEAPVLVMGSFGMGGGTSWQDTTDNDQELIDFIREAHEHGIEGIDTAPVYGLGRSERIVGEAIKPFREGFYLSTKCAMQWRTETGVFKYTRDGKSVYANFTKESLIQDVEDALRRLQTDYVDMMIVHQPPTLEEVPVVMDTLQELKESGKIRAIGLSNTCLTDHAVELVETALKYGRVDLCQEGASLLTRKNLGDFLDMCNRNNIVFQNYSGLEKGALAGKILPNITEMTGDNRSKYKWFQPAWIPKLNALTEELQKIAEKYGCTVPVLALAWLRAQSPNVNLLVGARKIQSVDDTMKVLDVHLSEEDIKKMSELSDIANTEG